MYARAVERACFVKLMNPAALTEGDWLVRDVRVGNRILHASVHGLTMKEIALLKRVKKSVWIKQGVPFALAFLIAFLMSEMLV